MEEEKQEKCVCNNYCPVCPKKTVARWEKRMMAVEENLRILMSRSFQTNMMMKRNHEKIMQGFHAIERAFKLNCNKQIEMTETLQDFSSDMGGGMACAQIFEV